MPPNVKLVKEAGKGERESGRGLVPAASHGRFDEPYNSYLGELKPRDNTEFQFACASSTDIRFRMFLEHLSEPRYRRYSLATIAKKCDISLPQFHEFWQSAQKNIALARAQGALPALYSDLIEDAKTRSVPCVRCDGFGFIPDGSSESSNLEQTNVPAGVPGKIRTCPQCKGVGTQREPGNQHARDKILETTGMVKRGGGAAVQITQHFGGMGIESAVDTMSQISFAVDDDVIDITPAPAPAPEG